MHQRLPDGAMTILSPALMLIPPPVPETWPWVYSSAQITQMRDLASSTVDMAEPTGPGDCSLHFSF